MNLTKTDYDLLNLIMQAQIGIGWISESTNLENYNQNFEQVVHRVSAENENIKLFNQGTVLMFAYVSLILPKGTLFEKLDTTHISTNSFKILENTYQRDKDKEKSVIIIRHVRNALAHGCIKIYHGTHFEFTDQNPNNSKEKFRTRVRFDLNGTFVSNYYDTLKQIYFDKQLS